MSSSTRPVSRKPATPDCPRVPLNDALAVATYLTPWGEGRLAFLGGLPFELELPDGAAGRISGRPACRAAHALQGKERSQGSGAADGAERRVLAKKSLGSGDEAAAATWVQLLERYFHGAPVAFDLDVGRFCGAHGFTAFETAVYRALAAVPHGEIASYRDLAVAAGRPRAWRAVGSAMALNPLPVILPCHRIVRSDGTLGHYGDDPTWKERLLSHEGVGVVHGPQGTPRAAARLVRTCAGGRSASKRRPPSARERPA